MGIRVERHKPRHLLLSIAYKLRDLLPLSRERKLDLLLDLQWITTRLTHEQASGLNLLRHTRNDFLLDRIKSTDKVLDLGCEDGSVTATIKAALVVGIDHNPAALEIARRNHPDTQFVCADARDYLATAERFDVLILSHVLEHLDDPNGFMKSITPHFDRIYVEVPDFDTNLFNQMRVNRGRRLVYCDNDHIAEFDRRELKALFKDCGLRILDREFIHGVMRYWLNGTGQLEPAWPSLE